MEIPKDQVLQMLRDFGHDGQVQQADQQLPDQVDPARHRDLLVRLGIGPGDLFGRTGGKLGL